MLVKLVMLTSGRATKSVTIKSVEIDMVLHCERRTEQNDTNPNPSIYFLARYILFSAVHKECTLESCSLVIPLDSYSIGYFFHYIVIPLDSYSIRFLFH